MNNLDKQYQALLQDILDNGVKKQDRTGTGTISVFGRQIRHKMSDGFPLLTTKKVFWKGVVTELLWFLRGDTNIKFLVDNNCHIWDGDAYKAYLKWVESPENQNNKYNIVKIPISKEDFIKTIKGNDEILKKMGKRYCDEFAKKWGDLGPVYGKQWRNWKTYRKSPTYNYTTDYRENEPIDQIANLIHDLKTNPDSRRLMVNAWNVGELDSMVLPPCHFSFQCYSHENDGKRYLSLAWNQRSCDVGLGIPFNIASYGLLLEIIAKAVNMISHELIGNLGDCHIYLNQIEGVKEQLTREPFPLPKLNINTEFWQTESGECGVGPLQTNLNGFEISDFTLENYQSHPSIKIPLSN
jgi:thymidylate synthase